MKSTQIGIYVCTLLLTACASQNQIRTALKEHPEWVFETIEASPDKFFSAVQKAQQAHETVAEAERDKAETARLEEELKNPKKAEISSARPIEGKADAPIQVVAYSDFQCPFCARGSQTLKALQKKYGDKISYVHKHLPLEMHPQAMPAALRFEALSLQGKEIAWKFHDALYKHQADISKGEKWLDEQAKAAGGNLAKMKKDMKSKEVLDRIEKDKEEASKFGFGGTPSYLVGGVSVTGARPEAYFTQIIDKLLQKNRETAHIN